MSGLRFLCDRQRHLICLPYSVENLHTMATQLGIGRHWFHGGDKPHYDIPARRADEIAGRCELVSPRRILREIRDGQKGSLL